MRRILSAALVTFALVSVVFMGQAVPGLVGDARAESPAVHPILCPSWAGQYGTVYSQPEALEEAWQTVPAPTGYNPATKPVARVWDASGIPPECLSPPDLRGESGVNPAPAPPACPVLTVRGRVFTYTSSDGLIPLAWAEVYVWDASNPNDASPDHGGLVFLASGFTDADGRFEIPGICNMDIDGSGTRVADQLDLVIQIAARSSAAVLSRYYFGYPDWGGTPDIHAVFNFVYSGMTGYYWDANGDANGVFDVGNRVAPQTGGDLRWAFLAYSQVLKMWDSLANRGPAYVPALAQVHYLAPCSPAVSCGPDGSGATGEPFPHYQVARADCKWPDRGPAWPLVGLIGLFHGHPDDDDCPKVWRYLDSQIHLDSKSNLQSRHALAHLYGHFIMERVYGRLPGVGPLHGDCPLWGTVPGCEAKDDTINTMGDFEDTEPPVACDQGSYHLTCRERLAGDRGAAVAWVEGWADFFATRMMNPESDPTYSPASSWTVDLETREAGWSSQVNEGFVAAVLNDLSDSAQDGFDTYYGTFVGIWRAFRFRAVDSLMAYWQAWIDAFHASSHADVAGAVQAMRQNGIATAYSVVNTPTGSDITPTSIRASWSNLGTNFYRAELHFSSSAGFYPTDATRVASWYAPNVPTSFTVAGLCAGLRYYFEVLWWDTGGWLTHSNVQSAQPGGAPGSIGPIYVYGDGHYVSRASVSIYNCQGATVYSGYTDSSGRVPGVTGLPAGSYTVSAGWTQSVECPAIGYAFRGSVSVVIPPNQSPTVYTYAFQRVPCYY